MKYSGSLSIQDILYDQYCEDIEKIHNKLLLHLNSVGEAQFRIDIWENCDFEVALSYVHPESIMESLKEFKSIQSAFINAIV